jgi:uracil-DNA glycosylase
MKAIVDSVLRIPSSVSATNFYLPSSNIPLFQSTDVQRLDQLERHIEATKHGDLVFVGEAPGWQGARQSGVAFTSPVDVGLGSGTEPSSVVVQSLIAATGITGRVLLWNAFPIHPHEMQKPHTNRPPTKEERDAGLAALKLAIHDRRVLCIGRTAERSVSAILGAPVLESSTATRSSSAISVRHPSHGGSTRFEQQAQQALVTWGVV